MLIHPVVGLFNGSLWSIFGLIIPGLIFYYMTKADARPYSVIQGHTRAAKCIA